MKRFLSSIIDVRRGEIAITSLMFLNYYLLLLTYYLLKPARDSLFMVKVSPEQLPLVYILTALVAAPVTGYYARMGTKLRLDRLIYFTTGAIVISLLGLRLLVQMPYQWIYYLFYTWVSIFGALTTSQFWLMANAVFDTTQAKRIFVLLGLGGIVGAFTGGEVTSLVVSTLNVSTENLLVLCIAVIIICTGLVAAIWRLKTAGEKADTRGHRRSSKRRDGDGALALIKLIKSNRHLSLTVGIIAMTMMVASFVDYQFKVVSYEAFSDKAELTSFLGQFYGRLSLASLALQMFLGYRVIRWLGVTGTIMFLPISLMFGSVAMVLFPGLIAGVALRGADGAFKYSLDKTGRELLFLPVPLELKKRTKVFIDMFVDRWFRGLAGGLLLLCTMVFTLSVQQISLVVIGLLAIWLTLVFMMRKEYVNSFRTALDRHEIDISDLHFDISDERTVNALIASLGSDNERQVLYGLRMLHSVKGLELKWPIMPLLQSRSGEIRLQAVRALIVHGDESLVNDVSRLLDEDDIRIRQAVIAFLCRFGEGTSEETLRTCLSHDDSRLRNAALAHIADEGGEEERQLVDSALVEAVLSDEGEDAVQGRVQLARLLSGDDRPELTSYLRKLLHDSRVEVVREALVGIGRQRDPRDVPWLIERMGDGNLRKAAREALAAFGSEVLPALEERITDHTGDLRLRRHLPRVLYVIGTQEAADLLVRLVSRVEVNLAFHVIRALNHIHRDFPDIKIDRSGVSLALVAETKRYYESVQVFCHFKEVSDDASRLLYRALSERLSLNLEHIFRLLGLVYPPRDIYNAYHGVISHDHTLRANAVEFLDNLLRSDIKKFIFPILEDQSQDMIIEHAQRLFNVGWSSKEDALAYLIEGRELWLRSCAIYCTASIRSEKLDRLVNEAALRGDPLARQTAQLVLKRQGQ